MKTATRSIPHRDHKRKRVHMQCTEILIPAFLGGKVLETEEGAINWGMTEEGLVYYMMKYYPAEEMGKGRVSEKPGNTCMN